MMNNHRFASSLQIPEYDFKVKCEFKMRCDYIRKQSTDDKFLIEKMFLSKRFQFKIKLKMKIRNN